MAATSEGISSTVKITDFEKTQQKCTVRAIDGKTLRVEQVDVCECIEVSGLGSSTTHDTILYYFENPRKSGGGDVEKVEYVDGETKALVFFKDPSVIDSVVDREHLINGATVKAIPLYPFLCEPPLKLTEEKSEEKSRTVEIIGISPKTIKDALLNFFENKRRSGGGEIEDIQYNQDEGFAEITFCSSEDAENISQKEGLQLDGAKLGLALKELPKVLPKDPCKLHVMGLSEKITKDGFLSFIEVVSGEEVQNMLFGSNSNVMVTFEDPPDLEKIQQKCRNRPLDGNHLQVEQVSICDCIEVSGLGSKTTRDIILYYFENPRKSGGGDVKKVEYVDGETKALVYFEEHSVVDSVVNHGHVINRDTLQVVPHHPFLGETSNEPGGGKREKQLNADSQAIAFIEKFFQKEFEELLQGNEVKLNQEQGKDEVVLVAINNKIDKAKWYESCDVIEKYINEITTQEVAVSSAAWGETIQKAKLRFSTAEDKIDILRKEKEKRILLRGKKQDVDTLAEQLEDLSKEIDKKIEYENAKATVKMGLTKKKKLKVNAEKKQAPTFLEENTVSAVGNAAAASQAKQVCTFVTPEGKKIILLKGDLTEFKVDVMVNSTNSRLQHLGGLARAVVVKGGKEIQDECDDYMSRNADLLDGEVFVSKPGKLPCKRLVHAVGPMWNKWSKKYREEESKEERILAQTVFNALEKAEKFTSIALSAISSGIFGFPIDLCAKTILESVLAYSNENPHVKLSEIYIIDMNDNVIQAFSKEMRKRFGTNT